MHRPALALLALTLACQSAVSLAQEQEQISDKTQSTASSSAVEASQIGQIDPSKVYWPEDTRNASSMPPSEATSEEQLTEERGSGSDAQSQITGADESERSVDQLANAVFTGPLAQLSLAEREVLLEAVQGTDLCDGPQEIEAIRRLCETRIETRANEFSTHNANTLSPEEKLLGERLEDTARPSLTRIIDRLARNIGRPDDLDNQAIASVALAGSPPPTGQPDDNADENAGDLPVETQQLINAIVQQLGNPGG